MSSDPGKASQKPLRRARRKARNRRQRHPELLRVGRELLMEGGYEGLTIERLAARAEYSRTTLYEHFTGRGGLAGELAAGALERIAALHERAARFEGGTRERVVAMVLAYEFVARFEPEVFRTEELLRPGRVLERMDPESGRSVVRLRRRIRSCYDEAVEAAARAGEVGDATRQRKNRIFLGLYAVTTTLYSLAAGRDAAGDESGGAPYLIARALVASILDGEGWHPLSGDAGAGVDCDRVGRAVFPEWGDRTASRSSVR